MARQGPMQRTGGGGRGCWHCIGAPLAVSSSGASPWMTPSAVVCLSPPGCCWAVRPVCDGEAMLVLWWWWW